MNPRVNDVKPVDDPSERMADPIHPKRSFF
jgi:hypothetical protein